MLGHPLRRAPVDPAATMRWPPRLCRIPTSACIRRNSAGLNYVGVALPVGQITPKQMIRARGNGRPLRLAAKSASPSGRTSSFPTCPTRSSQTVKKALRSKIGFDTQQSNIAQRRHRLHRQSPTANTRSPDTKGHALALADYLEKKLTLDQPVNIHVTGCPNSCAQHYIGDIGLLGTKVQGAREADAYHVFVGGGFGENQAMGRQVFSGISVRGIAAHTRKNARGLPATSRRAASPSSNSPRGTTSNTLAGDLRERGMNSPLPGPSDTLIDELLAEQRTLTAVETIFQTAPRTSRSRCWRNITATSSRSPAPARRAIRL